MAKTDLDGQYLLCVWDNVLNPLVMDIDFSNKMFVKIKI